MSFQMPTNTTVGSTGFSFGLPQTTKAGTVANPLAFGNIAGGDAGINKPLTFGAPNAATAPVGTPDPTTCQSFASAATVPTTTTLSFNFGTPIAASVAVTAQPNFSNIPKPTTASMVAPTTTTGSLVGLGGSTGFSNLSTTTKTTDSKQVCPASQLSYNQLEEHINKWTLELEEQEKVFTDQATQINAWDKVLISNNQKILALNEAVQKVKADQQTLEQELEFIGTQHKELEESILPLQKEFMNIPPADVERSLTYMLVENLDTQLKQMSEDLKEIIDNLNEASKGQDNMDPIIQIGKILNAHMSSLQWIESSSSNINNKLEDLGKMHENFQRETERSFRSAYYN